jgi:hypothetical protein
VDWIHLAEESDKWQAVVNTAPSIQGLQNAGNFLTKYLLKKDFNPWN